MALAGAGRALHGDAAVRGELAGDPLLLLVGGQRRQEAFADRRPLPVVARRLVLAADQLHHRGGQHRPVRHRALELLEEPQEQHAAPADHQPPRRLGGLGQLRAVVDPVVQAEGSQDPAVQRAPLRRPHVDRLVRRLLADAAEPLQVGYAEPLQAVELQGGQPVGQDGQVTGLVVEDIADPLSGEPPPEDAVSQTSSCVASSVRIRCRSRNSVSYRRRAATTGRASSAQGSHTAPTHSRTAASPEGSPEAAA